MTLLGKSKIILINMNGTKGLTEIWEQARGFVGRAPRHDTTIRGKKRVRFELGCGVDEPDRLKYCTWRYCIAYGDIADELSNIMVGSYILVRGWLSTEAVLDDAGKPRIENEKVIRREHLVCTYAKVMDRKAIQEKLPLEVGRGA